MSSHDLDAWMWADAVKRLERAEGLQRRFFKPAGPRPPRQWEPPVDIFETDEAVWVVIALPGVSSSRLTELEIRGDELLVAGERPVPAPDARAALHRLEIPHGRFERRVVLPWPRLALAGHELVDGCLYLTLHKR